jgi:predicted ATPase/DNA-binding winged helix-turn-helix (wHTH) protein
MSDRPVHRLSFGPFELSRDQRTLLRNGAVVALGDRALDLLIYLAERPGQVIAKQELIDNVWSDVTVEEGSLRVHVAAIRKALGDGQFGDRYIANVQGRGYSFVGAIARREAGIARQGRLPLRPARMVGRDPVVDEVKDGIREHRFVTLLGPGGVGKTTVAVAVGHAIAEEFNGEVYLVDLTDLVDPKQVASAVGKSLGLALGSEEPSLKLIDLVRSRKLLVILDSCEHLIEAAAAIAEQLYQETAEVRILATSREMLRVEGERCCHVPPLDFPPHDSEQTKDTVRRYPAMQLFVERMLAGGRSSAPTEAEVPLIAEICRRLDGLPLAIALAAGQAASLGVKNTAARLMSRTELWKLGRRTNVARHRTLKATLDWSFDLLTDVERIVFRRIAPFVGYFTLEDARYVAGASDWRGGEIFDAIAGLAGKSLISTRLVQGQPQYRLLDTTRSYALDRLGEHAEADAIFLRYAQYTVEQVGFQSPVPSAPPLTQRAAASSDQLGDIRAAPEHSSGPRGDREIARRYATTSAAFGRTPDGTVSAADELTEHLPGHSKTSVKAAG